MSKLVVAFAGPLVNIIIAIIVAILPEFRYQSTVVYTNLLIGLFNLIPIYPLDGGRIISEILKCFFEKSKAEKMVYIASNINIIGLSILAVIGTIWLENIAILAIILYLWVITIVENKRYKMKSRVYKILNKEVYENLLK